MPLALTKKTLTVYYVVIFLKGWKFGALGNIKFLLVTLSKIGDSACGALKNMKL